MSTACQATLDAYAQIERAFGPARPRRAVEPAAPINAPVNPLLGVIYSPKARTEVLAARLEAQGVAIVWEEYGGFRTMTPAEKAAMNMKKAA